MSLNDSNKYINYEICQINNYTLLIISLGTVIYKCFWKKNAHLDCIYLIKNKAKTVILWNY